MPVLISFLNATAGLAAALCGFVVDSGLLVACGAAVAASGSILTRAMCRAMNRSAARLFLGTSRASGPPAEARAPERTETSADPTATAVAALEEARSVVIIPGYGMALSDAQLEVAKLAERLASMDKDVKFAIHPIAGRMPGHMHVLLAEAEVDYALFFEPGAINPQLPQTDLVVVVGACDVVNPAAIRVAGTPISGMPILRAHEARRVIVLNLDREPGYSGVENPLYDEPKTVLVLGDARESLQRILAALEPRDADER
jgi:NAD(P) transhydrogenase subunit beta